MKLGEVVYPERAMCGKPLAGVRVLSVEQFQALPYATQLMSHLGAEIVKVENPHSGDAARAARLPLIDEDGEAVGSTFARNNLNKSSIAINIKAPEGAEIIRELVKRYDVFAESSRPGSMDAVGLGYGDISRSNERIIYLSISGFGNSLPSPYKSRGAYAPIAEAMAGFYEAGRTSPDELPRVGSAGALGDIGTSLFAVIGVLAALRHRETMGHGQYVDMSMFDAMVAMADMVPSLWSLGAPLDEKGWVSQSGVVAAFAALDGYFVVHVTREAGFARLAQAVSHPEWLRDERLVNRGAWGKHLEDVIRPDIESWARQLTRAEACELLAQHGVVAGPSNRAEDVVVDPHVRAHHMLIEIERSGQDPFLVVGNPIKLSHMAEGPVRRWPALGADTQAVLADELKISAQKLDELRDQGVIG
jgi:formyl-CoA transferase